MVTIPTAITHNRNGKVASNVTPIPPADTNDVALVPPKTVGTARRFITATAYPTHPVQVGTALEANVV